jgi:hypothetical protein
LLLFVVVIRIFSFLLFVVVISVLDISYSLLLLSLALKKALPVPMLKIVRNSAA